MQRPQPQRATGIKRGFTLLEMLLAMVITGIVGGVLYGALSVAFNAREAARQEVDAAAVGRRALEIVRGDLAGVLEPSGVLAGAFVGTDGTGPQGYPADELRYVTNHAMRPTEAGALGELRSVELRLADPEQRFGSGRGDDAAGRRLVRDISANVLARTEPARTRQTLARRVVSMDLRYHTGSEWVDAWDSGQRGNALPSRVAVTLKVLPYGVAADAIDREAQLITVRREFAPLLAPSDAQRRSREGADR